MASDSETDKRKTIIPDATILRTRGWGANSSQWDAVPAAAVPWMQWCHMDRAGGEEEGLGG